MKKSVDDWCDKYDAAKGNASQKTLALFREYAGASVTPTGTVYVSTIKLLFSGSWARNNTDVVAKAIAQHLEEDNVLASRDEILTADARKPAYIIYLVRQALAGQNTVIKPDGDLDNLFKALMKKNNLTDADIKDIQEPKTKSVNEM